MGKATRRAMEILVEMGKFYDAKRMVPVSMAYLVEGPSVAVPGETVKWLNGWRTRGVPSSASLPLSP